MLDKLPGVTCSNCSMSGECPQYSEGAVCAFTPAFRSLSVRDVDSHLAIKEHLLTVVVERLVLGGQFKTGWLA